MTFALTIETDEEAFVSDFALELSWVLYRLAETIVRDHREASAPFSCALRDVRGNTIGEAVWSPTKKEPRRTARGAERVRKAIKPQARKRGTTVAAKRR
jgi:hypothetical protein